MARQMSISVAKASDKTSIDHNNRTMNKSELNKLTHIDQSRLEKNEYLVNIPIEEMYEKEFGEALSNYNAKQKRNDRKIDNYYEHICKSKRHMPQQEIIFQVGEYQDFLHEETREMAKDILREHFERFQKDNPNLKIYNAVIHDDEATPHLHINFVPVADGYKRGLEKQVSFDRALIQQESTLNQEQPFTEWRAKNVMQLEKALNEKHIERRVVGTFDYKNQKEFKLKQDLEQEILGLRAEKHDVEQDLDLKQEKIGTLEARSEKLEQIANTESAKAVKYADERLKGVKPVIFNKDMVQIPKKDLKELEKAFKGASISNERVLKKNKELEQENAELFNNNQSFSRVNKTLNSKIQMLEHEVEVLREDKTFNEQVFDLFKPYIKKYHDQLQRMLTRTPFTDGLDNFLKGFVAGTLDDKDFSHAKEVGLYANKNSYELALENYEIGSTVLEHKNIQENKQQIRQSRSYGMSL